MEGSNKHNVQDQAREGTEALRDLQREEAKSTEPVSGGRQDGRQQPPEKVTDPKEHDLPLF